MWTGLIRLMIGSSGGNDLWGFIKGEKVPNSAVTCCPVKNLLTDGGVM